MLELRELTRHYGDVAAVQGFSLRIEKGQCFGLLGPNGAGKSTTISMIVGALTADSGQVLIDGRPLSGDTDPLKRTIGFVPQELALYDEISAADNLHFFGTIYGLNGAELKQRIRDGLELVGLAERADDVVGKFSGGMKRRLNIAAALLHQPQLLILDEPTVGVDPQSRNAIFDNVQALHRAGVTVLYTTHYMEEVERLCDHVAIMDGGKLVANDTLAGLYELLPARNRLVLDLALGSEDRSGGAPSMNGARNGASAGNGSGNGVMPGPMTESALAGLRELPGVTAVELNNDRLTLGLENLAADTPGALLWLAEHHYSYTSMASENANLEEVFLHLTGRKLRDA